VFIIISDFECVLIYDLLSFEGGSQFKITLNDTILINRIDAETGNRIRIEKVSLVECLICGLTIVDFSCQSECWSVACIHPATKTIQ